MRVYRQSLQNRIIHWGVAISIFGLILSGLFEMPIANRYFINTLPLMGWVGNCWINLTLHYIFAFFLIFFSPFMSFITDLWANLTPCQKKAMLKKLSCHKSDDYR